MRSLQAYRSILWHAILNRLPISVRRVIAALAVLIEEPEPEALPTKSRQLALLHLQTTTWGWLPALALTGALGVLSLAHAYTSARSGAAGAEFFFWAGLLLIFVPSSIRLLSPASSRFERITLLCIMGIYFCLTPVLSSPFSFSSYDEFLHWRTADDILRTRHLFKTNTMLVASPFYPGLEIVTNALSTLSGLNTFAAGHIVIGIVRLVMMLSLFMLYERITESARIASIATLIYMTNPHFLTFDAMFSYESIALPLAMFAVFAIARHDKPTRENRWMVPVAWIALAAVAVTHHMTDFVFDGLLVLWTLIYAWQHRRARGIVLRSKLVWTTCFGVVVTIITVSLIGDPVTRYLSTYFSHALDDLGHVLTGTGGARQLFAAT
ncbi:MAG: hypothetical protein IMW89_21220, partial [Ktedonobacteraceae bacterium]|nr:hypothetical protein [Ktedonobacteraceae bacterium]